jgi:hypothetical protein
MNFIPSSGYIVAQKGFEKAFDFYPNLNVFQEQVLSYLHKDILSQISNRTDVYLGFWLNESKIYFDIVERIHDRETAIKEGIRNGQKSIWDASNQKEIFLVTRVSNDPDIETDKKY